MHIVELMWSIKIIMWNTNLRTSDYIYIYIFLFFFFKENNEMTEEDKMIDLEDRK